MYDTLRDSTLGQIVRLATRRRVLKYLEEEPDFQLPEWYDVSEKTIQHSSETPGLLNSPSPEGEQKAAESTRSPQRTDLGERNSARSRASIISADVSEKELERGVQDSAYSRPGPKDEEAGGGVGALAHRTPTAQDLHRTSSRTTGVSAQRTESHPVTPTRTADGKILVDWYTTDDPENPQNWTLSKKVFVTAQICVYTFAVYIGSSIYVAGEEGIMKRFGVSTEAADLGLALYVIAYGLGPMLWSPLGEIPAVGRNPPYILTFGIFVILCVPAALTPTFGGLLTVRFLLGFFRSPCLGTGGASFNDMYALIKLPYPIAIWSTCAVLGPAIGPVISGFSVQAENWRWPQWELLWMSGPTFLLIFALLPETSADTILLRRARRLRELTGDPKYMSRSEIKQHHMSPGEIAFDALIKPWEINILDPAVLFSTIYTAIIYAIYYAFFESFPLVSPPIYHFNLGETGLAFVSMVAALGLVCPLYMAFMYYVVEPQAKSKGMGPPEGILIPGMFGSFFIPIGKFLFGDFSLPHPPFTWLTIGPAIAWTTRRSVHWIASIFGVFIDVGGTFIVIQSIFLYLPSTYPQYAASLFAANDFARSGLATAGILWSRPLYLNIGVPAGVSMLGGFTCACVVGIFALFYFGARLRARSRFAVK